MKNTETCPKCSGTKLIRVKDGSYHNKIALELDLGPAVPVTRYVCTDCGYVESWVDEQYLSDIRFEYRVEQRKR